METRVSQDKFLFLDNTASPYLLASLKVSYLLGKKKKEYHTVKSTICYCQYVTLIYAMLSPRAELQNMDGTYGKADLGSIKRIYF